jgi:hypothetical protein
VIDVFPVGAIEPGQLRAEGAANGLEGNLRLIAGVELVMDDAERLYAGLGIGQGGLWVARPDVVRLERQEAGYDLQVVLDAMVDLLKQHFLLVERLPQKFGLLAVPYVVRERPQAGDGPCRVPDRRQVDRDLDDGPVLALANGFLMVDAFAVGRPAKRLAFLVFEARRDDEVDRLPDRPPKARTRTGSWRRGSRR